MDYEINVGGIHREAIQLVKKNYGKILLALLIIIGVGYGVNMVCGILTMPFNMYHQLSLYPLMEDMRYSIHSFDDLWYMYGQMLSYLLPIYILIMGVSFILKAAIEPLNGGRRLYMLDLSMGKTVTQNQLFYPFKRFWKFVGCYFWIKLWVFLWSLLLIIPGIVKAISYSMTPYLIAQYENLTVREAMDISKRITDGYKGKLFQMYLLLFAWSLITILCFLVLCCLGLLVPVYLFLWFIPLLFAFEVLMYHRIKEIAFARGTLTAEELRINITPDPTPEL